MGQKVSYKKIWVYLSKVSMYGYSEVKTATFNIIDGRWGFDTNSEQEYDTLFLVCMDENELWKDVERIYAIPWEDAVKRLGISVIKESSRISWYEKYRIDEKPFNDAYHNIGSICPILRKENKKIPR